MTATENQFADPNQVAQPKKATARFEYPLPTTPVAPVRRLKYNRDKGGYTIQDPTSSSATKRTVMFRDSQLTKLFTDNSGLADYTRREAIAALGQFPEYLASLNAASSLEDLAARADNIAANVKYNSYGSSALEWSSALIEWIDHIEYGGTEPVPDMFAPYVTAYLSAIAERGWTFVPEMSQRYITSAGVTGVLPQTPVFSNTGRVYVDTHGSLYSIQLTTSSNIHYRLVSLTANAGFASMAQFILSPGNKGVWTDNLENWENTMYGVVNILRTPTPEGEIDIRFIKLDEAVGRDLATTALEVHHISGSNAVKTAISGSTLGYSVRDEIIQAIRSADKPEDLPSIFRTFEKFWTDEYTQLGNQRIAELQTQ